MSDYEAVYEALFTRNLRRYASIKQAIKRRVDRILTDPYQNTEALGDAGGKLNLIGVRSARVYRNFRIIFVILKSAALLKTVNSASVKSCRIKRSCF